jgi:ubiquitin C-terminal hydrolase
MFHKSYTPVTSKGLNNQTNACFMNSALQMLYSIDEYRNLILKSRNNNNKNDKNVIMSIKKIFNLINNSKNVYIERENLEEPYVILYKSVFNEDLYLQQDSQEFLSSILDKSNNYFSNLNKLYQYNFISKTYCSKNNQNVLKEDVNNDSSIISLDIIRLVNNKKELINNTLTGLLKSYQKPELLNNEEKLNRCLNNFKSYKKININIPKENKYLFIQLKRFIVTNINYEEETINGAYIDDYIKIEHIININGNKYFLLGAILRCGTFTSGHYIYTTFKNGRVYKTYNDSEVINNKIGNYTLENNAYILLYAREYNNLIQNTQKIEKINEIKIKTHELDANIKKNIMTKNFLLKTKIATINHNKENIEHKLDINKKYINKSKKYQTNSNKNISIKTENIEKKIHNKNNLLKHEINLIDKKENNIKKQLKLNNLYTKKLQQEENNYNLAKNIQQENNNYNLAKKIQQENNNYNLAKKLQQEDNNYNLAKKLQQENNNYNLAKNLQKENNYNLAKNLQKEKNNYNLAKNIQQENNNYNLAKKLQQEDNNKEEINKYWFIKNKQAKNKSKKIINNNDFWFSK